MPKEEDTCTDKRNRAEQQQTETVADPSDSVEICCDNRSERDDGKQNNEQMSLRAVGPRGEAWPISDSHEQPV